MANRLYIQIRGTDYIFECPVLEDITFDIQTTTSSWGELSPLLDMAGQVATKISGGRGRMGGKILGAVNLLDAPRWNKTDPLKFSVKVGFYTQEDPKKDVFDKFVFLSSLAMLSKSTAGDFILPGISAQHLSAMLNAGFNSSAKSLYYQEQINATYQWNRKIKAEDYKDHAKIIAVEIPGVVYLDMAMLMSCNPTFSKQKTESGFPLWCNMDITIGGLFPASDKIFDDVAVAVKQSKKPIGGSEETYYGNY